MTENDGQIKYESIFKSLPIVCAVLTADEFRYVTATKMYVKTSRKKLKDFVNQVIFEAFPDNPYTDSRGSNKLKESLEIVAQTKAPHSMGVLRYDIEIPDSEGGGYVEKWWRVINTPVLDEAGKIIYIIHFVDDINNALDVLENAEDVFSHKRKRGNQKTIKTR